MNFTDFRIQVQDLPYILSREVVKLHKNPQVMRNQLSRWEKKGLIVKLRQGMYILNDRDRKIMLTRTFLANQMYEPSYVSLEYVLGLYDLIPERVETITSVTTRKTACFKNKFGDFIYQHVKPQVFRGFSLRKDNEDLRSFIAEPEKAVVDFMYFHRKECNPGHIAELLIESYRFQNMETLKPGKILYYARLFTSGKLRRASEELRNYLKKGLGHA